MSDMVYIREWKPIGLAQGYVEYVNSALEAWWCRFIRMTLVLAYYYAIYQLCGYTFRELDRFQSKSKY